MCICTNIFFVTAMTEESEIDRSISETIRLWNQSKREIFRLQLLNTYWEDTKTDAFKEFMKGKPIDPMENPGFKDFVEDIAKKRADGVNIVNMQVLDLPISDALRFGMGFLRVSEKNGQRSLFVERKNVTDLVKGFKDFYVFDSEIVMNIIYDKNLEGRYLGSEKIITDPKEVTIYTNLRDKLIEKAFPMEDFLKEHHIDIFSNS